jgi:hypothetical protein
MMANRTPHVQMARRFIGFVLVVSALLFGIVGAIAAADSSRPVAASAGQPGTDKVPLASISLNRLPSPPNCVVPGGVESFNWQIQFESIPDHYIYFIRDPNSNVVYGPFTVNIQGQPSPVIGSDNWPVPSNAIPVAFIRSERNGFTL